LIYVWGSGAEAPLYLDEARAQLNYFAIG